ncbi:MAG: urease accessory protein UreE [Alphaproteobacteria bacterium]|nr:urease accessory protein UreE [Alphaproteobacteria bacterium]
MQRISFMSSRGAWSAAASDTIVLDHRQRAERNVPLTGVNGTQFEIALPADAALRGGDALVMDDGKLIEIVAAPELLAEARHADARIFARLAYHIGRSGLATEIQPKRIRFARNAALEETLKTLGAKVLHIEAPLEPDTGAFEAPQDAPAIAAHDHHHGHHHDHGQKHDHGHDHKHDHHSHDHKHAHDHKHGHDHKHDHGHDHDHKHDHGHKH